MAMNGLLALDDDYDGTLSGGKDKKAKSAKKPSGRTARVANSSTLSLPVWNKTTFVAQLAPPPLPHGFVDQLPPPPAFATNVAATTEAVERMPRVDAPRKFDTVAALINQGIDAYANRNAPVVRDGGYVVTANGKVNANGNQANNAGGAGSAIGQGAGNAVDGILAFFQEHPYMLALGGLGLFLFMQPSPSQRKGR